MVTCRYVGSGCSMIGDREFDAIGQRAMLSEQGFREAVLGNAPFIGEDEFLRVGFSQDELDEYGPLGARIDPTQSFIDRLALAQQLYHGMRSQMLGRGDVVFAEVSDTYEQETEPATA